MVQLCAGPDLVQLCEGPDLVQLCEGLLAWLNYKMQLVNFKKMTWPAIIMNFRRGICEAFIKFVYLKVISLFTISHHISSEYCRLVSDLNYKNWFIKSLGFFCII